MCMVREARCTRSCGSLWERISAGHDRSDGGLAAAVCEMAFAGNCGVSLNLSDKEVAGETTFEALFHEELGLVLEVAAEKATGVEAEGGAVTSDKAATLEVATSMRTKAQMEFWDAAAADKAAA